MLNLPPKTVTKLCFFALHRVQEVKTDLADQSEKEDQQVNRDLPDSQDLKDLP